MRRESHSSDYLSFFNNQVKALILHGMSEEISYRRPNGSVYKRPLLKEKPRIIFKSANEIMGLSFRFTCPFEQCACKMSTKTRAEKRLKGLKTPSCPFQRRIKCVDTFLFTGVSLQSMVQDLHVSVGKRGIDKALGFPICKEYSVQQSYTKEQFEALIRSKSFFPYELCTSWIGMESQVSPPAPEDFASLLTDSKGLTPCEHEEFVEIWRLFEIQSLAHLLRFYNIADTLLLGESVRFLFDRIHKITGIYATHVFTISSLAVYAALLNSKDPHNRRKRLFLPFLEKETYEIFSEALTGVGTQTSLAYHRQKTCLHR